MTFTKDQLVILARLAIVADALLEYGESDVYFRAVDLPIIDEGGLGLAGKFIFDDKRGYVFKPKQAKKKT